MSSPRPPQFYPESEGLQTAFAHGPEVARDTTPPIVVNDNPAPIAIPEEYVPPPVIHASAAAPASSFFRKRIFWLLVILGTIVAICLGVGLGVGLSKNASNSQATSATSTSSAGPTPTSAGSSNGTPLTQHGVLNNTSLAACISFDGDKHVFFQDVNGSIRHAISSGPSTWSSTVDFLPISPQPQNNTPLDVYLINTPTQSKPIMSIFYLSADNVIQAMTFSPGSSPIPGVFNTTEFAIPPTGKTLSVSRVITNNSNFDNNALLFYETSSGNITGHYGSFVPDNAGSSLSGTWTWSTLISTLTNQDITKRNGWLGPPIAVDTFSNVGEPSNGAPVTVVTSFNPSALYNSSTTFDSSSAYQNFTGPVSSPGNYLALFASDIHTFTAADALAANASDWIQFFVNDASRPTEAALSSIFFFVANQGLKTFSTSIQSPDTVFPYSRLAFANSTNASASYIYHQLNDSIIIEDAYSLSSGWGSTAIEIPTS
ncbi:hypothetical protein MMC10_010869 [Thelotrema lepadinum]|nr:hypothetical protein [Thelotrema lepadinum]